MERLRLFCLLYLLVAVAGCGGKGSELAADLWEMAERADSTPAVDSGQERSETLADLPGEVISDVSDVSPVDVVAETHEPDNSVDVVDAAELDDQNVVCVPQCQNFDCEEAVPDGCGGFCSCPAGFHCSAHSCVAGCGPQCLPDQCDQDPAGMGCGCTQDSGCQSGTCWDFDVVFELPLDLEIPGVPAGPFCSLECQQESDCPFGTTCMPWAMCDPVSCPDYCVPSLAKLGWPCRGLHEGFDYGCDPNAECVSFGADGWFCGALCEGGKGCPAGLECQSLESELGKGLVWDQCIPAGPAAACSAEATAAGAWTPCYVENPSGICFGTRSCVVAEGETGATLSPCSAPVPDGTACQTNGGCGDQCGTMLDVPASVFTMGTDDPNAGSDHKPAHEVTLSAYRIRKYQVTAGEYTACVLAGACTAPTWPSPGSAWNWEKQGYTYGAEGKEQHPINGVTHYQAEAYCAWAGQRLPTEAEWERAAGGGSLGLPHPWGSQPADCNLANTGGTGKHLNYCVRATTPVGSYPHGVSPVGAMDMVGNVREWVLDLYSLDGYQFCAGGCTNPTGAATGSRHVVRGVPWAHGVGQSSTTARASLESSDSLTGFRCAESLP